MLAFVSVLLLLMYGPLSQWFIAADRTLYDQLAGGRPAKALENSFIVSIDPRRKSEGEPPSPGRDASGQAVPAELRGGKPDVTEASAQVRLVLRYASTAVFLIATWIVWADVLPALGVVHRISF